MITLLVPVVKVTLDDGRQFTISQDEAKALRDLLLEWFPTARMPIEDRLRRLEEIAMANGQIGGFG